MSSYSVTGLRTFQDPGVVWQSNSVLLAFVGGLLVGIVVLTRYLVVGKITGISGFLSRSIKPTPPFPNWSDRLTQNLSYVGGLVCAGGISHAFLPECFEDWSSLPTARLVIGGVLVGFGTVLGSGCTSGHGISSLSSFRLRGLVATCCFMLSAFVTAMSANTGSYLPFFNNTLPVERSGAVVGVCIGACALLVVAARALHSAPSSAQVAFKTLFDVVCGIVFGLAMAVTNMTKLSATISFLDLRFWNPALAFVMGGGILICATGFAAANAKFAKPLLEKAFWVPDLTHPDARLVVGSLIFGVGWGLAGACPGPALVNLGSTNIPPLIYNACLVFGMLLEHIVDAHLPRPLAPPTKAAAAAAGAASGEEPAAVGKEGVGLLVVAQV